MKKFFLLIFLLSLQFQVLAQDQSEFEKPPVFPECESQPIENLRNCFYNNLSQLVYDNFDIPQIVADENYKGNMVVLFEVDTEGNFVVLYVDAIYDELKTAAQLVFAELPKISPATYNGNPTYKQYSYEIAIPLVAPSELTQLTVSETEENAISEIERKAKTEIDSINASISLMTIVNSKVN